MKGLPEVLREQLAASGLSATLDGEASQQLEELLQGLAAWDHKGELAPAEARRVVADLVDCLREDDSRPIESVIDCLREILAAAPAEELASALMVALNEARDPSSHDAGSIEPAVETIEIEAFIQSAADEQAQEAQEKGVELVVNIAEDVPRKARGDRQRLAQVLEHLIRNAIEHTTRGEILVLVTARDGGVRIEVQDSGCGMTAEVQAQVFQSFWTGDDDRKKKTGAGLVLCKQLCEGMGGVITFASEIGRGTTFRVDLPLEIVEGPAAGTTPFTGYSVLVVGRSYELRTWVEESLSRLGVRVETRPDPQSITPEDVLAGGYDALLLDWDMPRGVVDFKDAITGAAEDERPWIVTLCPHGDPMVAEILGAFSGDGHLQKPIASAPLRELMADLFGRRPARGGSGHGCQSSALRVLLVDDNVLNRRVGLRMLARLGFSVDEAGDGKAALELLVRDAFDFVLLDIQMPRIDGYEVARTWRKREQEVGLPRIPVVALTALDAPSDHKKALESGMDDVLQKPLRLKELEEILHDILGRRPRNIPED